VEIVIARDGRLLKRTAQLDPPRHDRAKIVAQRDAPPGARGAFTAWLGEPHPAWVSPREAAS
jgi:hypothetical protein